MDEPRIIVALDVSSATQALSLASKLDPALCRLKVGKELFTAEGPALLEKLMRHEFEIFLDLKFHDIPNTVANACKVAASLGVWMINVHALGGRKMLLSAREALPNKSTKLIAVTLLTSMGSEDLRDIGISTSLQDTVKQLALLVNNCGLDGVVCSPLEINQLRQTIPNHFLFVTPGIRPSDGQLDDQQRVATPAQAIKSGSDYLVIGRPITQAEDPLLALQQISNDIKAD